jgi:cobalamin biosynthesis Mg chelatase CobN
MRTTAVLIACATSALAYSVTVPNASQGWTNSGSQTVSWQKVSTDRDNFTIVLTNQDRSVLSLDQTLASLVDGNLGTQQVNPPGGGWIVGGTYRVNLVQDSQSLNSILAQSQEFNVTESSSSSSSATGSSTSVTRISTTAALTTGTGTTLIATTGAASGASSSVSSTGAATTSNAALPVSVSSSGFVGLLALLGAMLF